MPTPKVVTVHYEELLDPQANLADRLEEAYGPEQLGILTISGIPHLGELRQRLLPLSQRLARLPDTAKQQYEDPLSSYNFGWSQGKESMRNGALDVKKGSFYANPEYDLPTEDRSLMDHYPTYCRPNIWPSQHLPELEPAFKDVARVIVQVGLLLVKQCDKYLEQLCGVKGEQARGKLVDVVQQSKCHKARLLHYFAPEAYGTPNDDADSWCGWHLDHGSITGLLSAMFLKGEEVVSCPDPHAGLYIRNRTGEVLQVSIPSDCVAYQLGEAIQVQSGGRLVATPHMVRAPDPALSQGITRNTLAVFMQPRWDVVLDPLLDTAPEDVRVLGWEPGMTFGTFTEMRIKQYYS